MIHLVTGGSASGKSEYAEGLIEMSCQPFRVYIATMMPWDEECVQRIQRHRRMRENRQFVTVECFHSLEKLRLPAGPSTPAVLLECMSNLVSNEFYNPLREKRELTGAITDGIKSLSRQASVLVVVTNEVFSDGMSYSEETREYMKLLGSINAEIAGMADAVTEVVCGIPLPVKR